MAAGRSLLYGLLGVFIAVLVALMTLDAASAAAPKYDIQEEQRGHWFNAGQDSLSRTILRPLPDKFAPPAKNVIIFVGDGMGVSTTSAARVYKGLQQNRTGPEGSTLVWERFPNVGLIKTYNVDKQVPDSAGTATAMFTGVKSRYYMLGLEASARRGECDAAKDPARRLSSIMAWAQDAGKRTGFVTTTRVTHATPAALYASINERDWECDSKLPVGQQGCVTDIARQLVESKTGQGFRVILGGGLKQFGQEDDSVSPWDDSCTRADRADLVKEWRTGKDQPAFVRSREDLLKVDVAKTSHLLGLFSPGHMPYALETNVTEYSRPSIAEMTSRAIDMLSQGPEGFALMVEGGRIDQAHHANMAHMAMEETVQFEAAVETALKKVDLKDTLVIVTADHSHGFTFNGYPARGSDIFGFANKEDETQYETLTYATGPGAFPELQGDRDSVYYRSFAGKFLKDAAHGGEDVALYAVGPHSHVYTGVFEQNHVGLGISYAACMGPMADLCRSVHEGLPSGAGVTSSGFPLALVSVVAVMVGLRHVRIPAAL